MAVLTLERPLVDDWDLVGVEVEVVDPEPVPGSTQCLMQVASGDRHTVARHELEPVVA